MKEIGDRQSNAHMRVRTHDQTSAIGRARSGGRNATQNSTSSEKQDISIVPTVFYTHIFLFMCAQRIHRPRDRIKSKIECSAHVYGEEEEGEEEEKRKSVCHAKPKMKEESTAATTNQKYNMKENERTNNKKKHKQPTSGPSRMSVVLAVAISEHMRASLGRPPNSWVYSVCRSNRARFVC